jgi:hypothetical protein
MSETSHTASAVMLLRERGGLQRRPTMRQLNHILAVFDGTGQLIRACPATLLLSSGK